MNGTCITRDCQILNLASRSLQDVPASVLEMKFLTCLVLDHNKIVSLVKGFCSSLKSVQNLSCIGNELNMLPDDIGVMSNLKELILTENNLQLLPNSIGELTNLKTLKLTGNQLTAFPSNFGGLCSLEELSADENCLNSLPDSFGLLSCLKFVELNDNQIQSLPVNFGSLKNLQVLNLSFNRLKELPDSFRRLEKLEELDLSNNNLEFLPEDWASAFSLVKLFADCNTISSIPKWFENLPLLEELSLKDNKISYDCFPPEFGQISINLVRFNLAGNYLTALCSTFGKLTKLEFIDLGSVIDELERRNFQNGNCLMYLPDNFGGLINLREAHLDENQLMELPSSFGDLVCLELLDLGQNHLQELPESFGNLCSLTFCQLSKNLIHSLPSSFGNLKKLIDLRLDNNQLTCLPETFFELRQLQNLDLFNNHLTVIPTALSELINLKRLDIDENDFGLPVLEVPHIFSRAKYPSRNPDLVSNWRGRPRQDLITVESLQSGDQTNQGENGPEKNFEQVLAEALERSSSLWKHEHNGSARQKYVSFRNGSDDKMSIVEEKADEKSDEEEDKQCDIGEKPACNEDDENDLWSDDNKPYDICEMKSIDECEEPEDWEKELVEEFDNPYEDHPVYKHPVKSEMKRHNSSGDNFFCPSDLHAHPIGRTFHSVARDLCQFEDADDDSS